MSRVANQTLRSFALVVTDRRWAAPLSVMALGFGVFVGVAVGPSATGSVAGTAQVIEMPASSDEGQPAAAVEAETSPGVFGSAGSSDTAAVGGSSLEPAPEPAPLAPVPVPPPAEDAAPKPAPQPAGSPAEGEEETELTGVVAHVNPAAGSYTIAISGGELVPVHAPEPPPPGARLSIVAQRLANGTFAEVESTRRGAKTVQVKFRGSVSFLDPDPADPAYTVSGRGASLLVHVPPDPSGAAPQLPVLGAYVTVTAAIEKPMPAAILEQRELEIEAGEPATYLDLAGVLTAVAPDASQISLSADDVRESGSEVTLAVPPGIDTGELRVGDSYLATATVEEGGSLVLAGVVSDEHRKGADDASTAQGDLRR